MKSSHSDHSVSETLGLKFLWIFQNNEQCYVLDNISTTTKRRTENKDVMEMFHWALPDEHKCEWIKNTLPKDK